MAWSRLRHRVVQNLRGRRVASGSGWAQVGQWPASMNGARFWSSRRTRSSSSGVYGSASARQPARRSAKTERSEAAAAGAEEVEVVLHRPGGQDGGTGEAEPKRG
ncbi:hypothetical protein C5746_42680 [Streptomyces atratus]|uniref:Uncharacterized protein n=1 Tax=Streptomyces atratus TaxID=1893 RepID=A0A2Z5J748_STRAR|nr:hypothetical protein C5746_00555 [Streptomyces atratus]AXE82431.1 hypothetical protein C5746_42680 [Streptomyces atratus]